LSPRNWKCSNRAGLSTEATLSGEHRCVPFTLI